VTSPIEAAKARHSLAAVARRTGIAVAEGQTGSVTVRCPMPSHGHPDRTPSLRLHLGDGIWCCFACSPTKADGTPKGADVIEWVRQSEGVADWRQAITILDSGVPLTNVWAGLVSAGPHRSSGGKARSQAGVAPDAAEVVSQAEFPDLGRTSPQRVQAALAAAWAYYTFGPLHERGVAYLTGRRIDVNVLEAHTGRAEVGYTPASSTGLVDRLRARGFTDDELVDAGLAYHRLGGGRVTDFYRQRVLIPVRDHDGRIAGFIGRNVGDERWPKYKNPPRTHNYDKAVNLYQPLPAPADADGQVVVVEGTLDAMAIAVAAIQADLPPKFCPVTQSGRELSERQLEHVLGLHPHPPVIGFDGDAPGRDSIIRVAIAAAYRGHEVVVTTFPEGADPASWLAEHGPIGLAAWTRKGCLESGRGSVRRAFPGGVVALHMWETARRDAERRGVEFDRTAVLEAVISETNRCVRHLPPRAATRWSVAAAEAIAPLAVAEAHHHVAARFAHSDPSAARGRWDVDVYENWQPDRPIAVDVGCEATRGPDRLEGLIERVTVWGQRLPGVGHAAFIQSATVAINDADLAC
jgi:DNA primase